MDLEEVTVSTGTFRAVKVTMTAMVAPPDPPAGMFQFQEWYAEDVGLG